MVYGLTADAMTINASVVRMVTYGHRSLNSLLPVADKVQHGMDCRSTI